VRDASFAIVIHFKLYVMKKQFLAVFACSILLVAGNVAFGQEATARLYAKNEKIWNVNTRNISTGDESGAVNVRALRHFKNSYEDTTGSRWYQIRDGFMVKLTRNNVAVRMGYNKQGGWENTIRTYTENKLPFEIRDIVKRAYYDCSIEIVEEIEVRRGLYYLVHICDNRSWKNVLVHEGELELIEEIRK
jgi:hypothetical protein